MISFFFFEGVPKGGEGVYQLYGEVFYLNGLLAIYLPGEVHHLGQTLHKVYQLHWEVIYLIGPEGHCAQLRLLAIHLPGEVHHLGQTLHKVYQLHGEVFDLIKLSKSVFLALKDDLFSEKKSKINHNFSESTILHIGRSILDIL